MLYFRQDRSATAARMARLPAWRRQIVETDAGSIDVLDIGKDAPRAILLITHGLGSLESFQEIAEALEARYPARRIIAYSRPGRGSSPASHGIEANDHLTHESLWVLPAILRALGITSADIVAHSDGVAVAMLFACSHPSMVERIVALSPQVHADWQFVATTGDLLADSRFSDDIARLEAEHLDPELAVRCWAAAREALAARPDHVLARLATLGAPLLLVQGLNDEYGAHQQMSALSAHVRGPMKWVILRNDGHFPQHDSTEVVLDLICGHLEDIEWKSGSGRVRTRAAR